MNNKKKRCNDKNHNENESLSRITNCVEQILKNDFGIGHYRIAKIKTILTYFY